MPDGWRLHRSGDGGATETATDHFRTVAMEWSLHPGVNIVTPRATGDVYV
jgi:hypothetical protein